MFRKDEVERLPSAVSVAVASGGRGRQWQDDGYLHVQLHARLPFLLDGPIQVSPFSLLFVIACQEVRLRDQSPGHEQQRHYWLFEDGLRHGRHLCRNPLPRYVCPSSRHPPLLQLWPRNSQEERSSSSPIPYPILESLSARKTSQYSSTREWMPSSRSASCPPFMPLSHSARRPESSFPDLGHECRSEAGQGILQELRLPRGHEDREVQDSRGGLFGRGHRRALPRIPRERAD